MTTKLEGVNTHDARLGRWLVVHSMMQLLSRMAVDIQGLWYCHGVPYFLNADLDHCPPWTDAKLPKTIRQATVVDSWCWLYAKGQAASRKRSKAQAKKSGSAPKPRYQVRWDEEGRFELSPSDKTGNKASSKK